MAENETLVAAIGFQLAPARLPARMRHDPRVERGVVNLAAVTRVTRGDDGRLVSLAAVGAAPLNYVVGGVGI
jgi:hypothetical protein